LLVHAQLQPLDGTGEFSCVIVTANANDRADYVEEKRNDLLPADLATTTPASVPLAWSIPLEKLP